MTTDNVRTIDQTRRISFHSGYWWFLPVYLLLNGFLYWLNDFDCWIIVSVAALYAEAIALGLFSGSKNSEQSHFLRHEASTFVCLILLLVIWLSFLLRTGPGPALMFKIMMQKTPDYIGSERFDTLYGGRDGELYSSMLIQSIVFYIPSSVLFFHAVARLLANWAISRKKVLIWTSLFFLVLMILGLPVFIPLSTIALLALGTASIIYAARRKTDLRRALFMIGGLALSLPYFFDGFCQAGGNHWLIRHFSPFYFLAQCTFYTFPRPMGVVDRLTQFKVYSQICAGMFCIVSATAFLMMRARRCAQMGHRQQH